MQEIKQQYSVSVCILINQLGYTMLHMQAQTPHVDLHNPLM